MDPASPNLIEIIDLTKDYQMGDQVVRALRGVSLKIGRGEFVSIMGPSGSGKSTLMNLLGCLDRPSSGSYLLDGRDVAHLKADDLAVTRNQQIGFVFQNFNLLGRTSALDNVALPLVYAGLARQERRDLAAQALEAVGLEGRRHHHPAQLSGGQQQRVAIARAMAGQPSIILADEPTGALDTRTGVEIMALFQQLNQQGITVIVVTHEEEVALFAGRILSFRDGMLVEDKRVDKPRSAAEILARLEPVKDAEAPDELG